MRTILLSIKRAILWGLNIRLWQIAVVAVFIAMCVLGWMLYCPLGGESTKVEGNTSIGRSVHFDNRLDVFRAGWDIHDRFEKWPAILPLAEMSNIAYSSESEARMLFQQFGFDSTVSIESQFHSKFAYVALGGDVVVVAFRGTDETEDWFSDVNIYLRQMPEGDLHSGFANAYGMLQFQIWREIERANPKHIWITGHSLGGAMALTCAYDLVVYRGRNVDGVITFGQPKIGKQNLATSLQKRLGDRCVHFVNESDPVPQLPPRFAHCGLLLWFRGGTVQKSSSYFRSLVMSKGEDTEKPNEQYVPVDQLPEMDEKQFEEFKRTYKRAGQPITTAPLVYGSILPWNDHPMNLYVKKVHDAVDRATGH
jgi:hypothetical protein